MIIFSDCFSFEKNSVEALFAKVKEQYKDSYPMVYNVSLDQSLKKHVHDLTKKDFPVVVEGGKVKDI